eukprot:365533-Chlamydomonas_euryale.AAC.11
MGGLILGEWGGWMCGGREVPKSQQERVCRPLKGASLQACLGSSRHRTRRRQAGHGPVARPGHSSRLTRKQTSAMLAHMLRAPQAQPNICARFPLVTAHTYAW